MYRKASPRSVVIWEQIAEVEGPPKTTTLRGRRPSLVWISLDLLFGPGTGIMGRRGIRSSAMHFYCVLHLKDGSSITFSQAITNLPALEEDIRGHLRRLHGRQGISQFPHAYIAERDICGIPIVCSRDADFSHTVAAINRAI